MKLPEENLPSKDWTELMAQIQQRIHDEAWAERRRKNEMWRCKCAEPNGFCFWHTPIGASG